MDKISNLLELVRITKKHNDEILDATGGRFNMFAICGVNHYENTHSAIIAEFLNPKGTHGLKSKFLNCFIDKLGDDFIIDGFDTANAKVRTEHNSGSDGRIDITIEDNNSNIIIIETKVYAEDQYEQLIRYNNYANSKYNNYQILYLTLDGAKASEQSSKEVEYTPISFKETIIDWLEECIGIAVRFPMVRETIIQYINHLRSLTNQDMDTKNKEEILDLLVNNYEAASTIFKTSYDEFLDRLTRRYFLPIMEEYALEKGLELKYERACPKWNGIVFRVAKPEWKKCDLVFSAESIGYIYGIQYKDTNAPLPLDIVKKIRDLNPNSNIKPNNVWSFYKKIDNFSWNKVSNKEYASEFAKECIEKIESILDSINDIEL